MTAALLAGITATSLVGSLHCLAMCGPLAGLGGGTRSLRLAATHSLGRLTTYVVLGALAGLVGGALDLAGRVGGLQRIAMIVAAAMVVTIGALQLLHVDLGRLGAGAGGKSTAFSRGLVRIRRKPPGIRAWLAGTMTGLLPCGWLWAFVVTAGGSGHAWSGALVMAAFWLGTVPAMVGLLAFAGPVVARLRARMPAITAVALIAVGLGALAVRWHDAGAAQVQAPQCPLCQHHGDAS